MANHHNRDSRPDSQVTRRTLLAVGSAAGAVTLVTPLVPVAAQAATETPVQLKYGEWKRSRDDWMADMERDGSDENGDRWCAATYRLADEILDIPSEGPMDLIYKMMAYTFHGQHEVGDGQKGEKLWAEARALVGA